MSIAELVERGRREGYVAGYVLGYTIGYALLEEHGQVPQWIVEPICTEDDQDAIY